MKKKIVIADDDDGIRDIFRLILEREGYELIIYSEGATLLQNMRTELPGVYLLDKQLSGMDGLDICKQLKNDTSTQDIPVIMISATPGLKDMSIAAGADDCLEKPFSRKDLLAIVEKNIVVTDF
jgi:DNA-binding response OmpR family regulator